MTKQAVTKEMVLKVKKYTSDERYSDLTHTELALLCGSSATSVSRIVNGKYDYLLADTPKEETKEDTTVVIPYEALKHMVNCEAAITAILAASTLSRDTTGALFCEYKTVFGILKAYLSEDTNNRVEALKRGAE